MSQLDLTSALEHVVSLADLQHEGQQPRHVAEVGLRALVDGAMALTAASGAGVTVDGAGAPLPHHASSPGVERLDAMLLTVPTSPLQRARATERPVLIADLAQEPAWRTASTLARTLDMGAVTAVPLMCRHRCVGVLTVHDRAPRPWDGAIVAALDCFARVAGTVVIGTMRAEEAERTTVQLQAALLSRVVIEQAKGIVAAQLDTDMDGAFAILREHARRTQASLRSVAEAVIELRLSPSGASLAEH